MIHSDDVQGGYMAARHLIGKGCKRMVHISGQQDLHLSLSLIHICGSAVFPQTEPVYQDQRTIRKRSSDPAVGRCGAEKTYGDPVDVGGGSLRSGCCHGAVV